MTKKEVRKLTYNVFTTIFYALCIAGLLWQVVQISENYSKFEVVSDIKFTLPESDKQIKSLNICFRIGEVMNHFLFDAIKLQYDENLLKLNQSNFEKRRINTILISHNFTIKETFDIALSSDELFIGSIIPTLRHS